MSRTTNQLSMFSQGEDLPLFSGTAQTGQIVPFVPAAPPAKQETLPGLGDVIRIKSWSLELGSHEFEMTAIGRGAFPYDCRSKDKHPNAMIYQDERGGWVGEYSLQDTGLGYFIIK